MCLDICYYIYVSISCLILGFVFYVKIVKKNYGFCIVIFILSMYKLKSIFIYWNIENMLFFDLMYNIRGEYKYDRILGIFVMFNFLFWNICFNGG